MKRAVLIVDDDRNFRYAMREMIPWEKYDFYVIAEAVHGKQAMEILEKQEVQLILTDMDMPVMNGVELTKAVKEKYPAILIVALSAFDDFTFVKESMKLGAEDYILKQDFDGEQIIKNLDDIWEKQKKNYEIELNRTELLREVLEYIQGKKTAISPDNKYYNKLVPVRNMMLCLVESKSAFIIQDAMERDKQLLYFMKMNDYQWVFIYQVPATSSRSAENEALQYILNEIMKNFDGKIQIGVGDIYGDITALPNMFSYARIALEYKMFFPKQSVFHYLDMEQYERARVKEYVYPKKAASLDIDEVLQELYKELVKQMPDEEWVNKSFHNVYEEYRSKVLFLERDMELLDFYEEIKKRSSLDDKIIYTKEQLEKDKSKGIVGYRGGNKEIRNAVEYIQLHYAEELSLNKLAEEVKLSENYLSNLFKQEMGENLVSYINRIRIENAKNLLLSTSMKVYEIAEAVGFHNATYLSTTFKKVTGMSISEFVSNT